MPSIRLNLTVNDDGSVTLKKFRSNARKSFKGAEKDAKSFGVAATAALAAVAYGAFKLAKSFGGLIKTSALMAARYETLGVVMNVVGKNAGYTASQMDAFEKSVRKSGISMIESREAVSRLAIAQLDLTRSAELARVAQDVAVVGNINSSEAFKRLVEGIQKGSLIMLKTIGISLTFEEGYKKLAKTLNKTASELTPLQKVQSRFNQVLQYGTRYAGTYEKSMETAGKQLLSLRRYVDDFRVKMGQAFGPATAKIVKRITALMKEWTTEVTTPEAQEKLGQMADDVASLVEHMADLAKTLPSVISGLKTLFDLNPWKLMDKYVTTLRGQTEFLKQAQEQMKKAVPSPEMGFDLAGADPAFLAAIQAEYGRIPKMIEPRRKKKAVTSQESVQKPRSVISVSSEELKMVEDQYKEWKKLDDLYNEIATASLPEYEKSVARITSEYDNWKEAVTDLQAANRISDEEAKQFTDQLTIRMKEEIKGLEKVNQAAADLGMTFASAFEDAIVAGGDLSDILKGLEQDIIRILARKTITEPLANSLTGLIGGVMGSFSGGMAMAEGGVINEPIFGIGASGQTYTMGEGYKKEYVVPADKMGGGVVNNFNIDARGADIGVDAKIRQGIQIATNAAYNKVAADITGRGAISQTIGR